MLKVIDTQSLTLMGLMSGTSVDGVDACLVRLELLAGELKYEILATHSGDMPDGLRTRLLSIMADPTVHLEVLCALNVAVGELFAKTANGLIQKHGINPASIDAIGSHGQTLYHWPPTMPGDLGGTMQIGEPTIIAEQTGIYTIADFRPGDMAAGGQGAPLVCFADQLLFQSDTIGRAIQNIGGIANVTVLPPRAAHSANGNSIRAFDTGPGNMLMDEAMRHFYQQSYDANGDIAASGTVQSALLSALNAHPYLQLAPPKTTGREQFGKPFFNQLLKDFQDIAPADWLATLCQFTADSIVSAYETFVFPNTPVSELVLGGGGARNANLISRLRDGFLTRGRDIQILTHADFNIPDQYKEALAFAILAWASLLHRPNNLPECTGATHPVILGKHVFPYKSLHTAT